MFHFELHNFHATKISSWNLNLAPTTAWCFCRRHVPCLQQRHQNQISCSDSSEQFHFFRSSKQVFLNFRARSRSLASATKVPRPTSYRMSQHLRGLITRWASSFVLIWLAWLSSLGPRNFHMTGLIIVVVLKGFCIVLKSKLTLKISSTVKPIPISSYNQLYFPPDFVSLLMEQIRATDP